MRDFSQSSKNFFNPESVRGCFSKLQQHAVRYGGDIGSGQGAFQDVEGRAHRGHDDFSVKAVIFEDGDDLLDDLHAPVVDIVEAADEGADVSRARLGGQQGLEGLENQGDVDLDVFRRQDPGGLEARPGSWGS